MRRLRLLVLALSAFALLATVPRPAGAFTLVLKNVDKDVALGSIGGGDVGPYRLLTPDGPLLGPAYDNTGKGLWATCARRDHGVSFSATGWEAELLPIDALLPTMYGGPVHVAGDAYNRGWGLYDALNPPPPLTPTAGPAGWTALQKLNAVEYLVDGFNNFGTVVSGTSTAQRYGTVSAAYKAANWEDIHNAIWYIVGSQKSPPFPDPPLANPWYVAADSVKNSTPAAKYWALIPEAPANEWDPKTAQPFVTIIRDPGKPPFTPEPATFGFLALGAFAGLIRRRRRAA